MRLTTAVFRRHAHFGEGFQYFKRFIDRRQQKNYRIREWHPAVGWQGYDRKYWRYDENRPWTDQFLQNNAQQTERQCRQWVKPITNWKIFHGDRVMILVGKDQGKVGLVCAVIKERNWVFVEGLNFEYTMQSIADELEPLCQREELPLLVTTQVALVDPQDNEATEVEWRFTEKGNKVRVSLRTGRIIPLPPEQLEDLVIPDLYVANETKDTREKDVKEVTFKPKLCTFEEDIMESFGIKENKKRKPTYWY